MHYNKNDYKNITIFIREFQFKDNKEPGKDFIYYS